MPLSIYLDTCCLNRLTDNPAQPRISAEAAAVEQVLDLVSSGIFSWIASTALLLELSRNPDRQSRDTSLKLIRYASTTIEPDSQVYERAAVFTGQGFGAYDALHLAIADAARVDVLFTVDDRFIARAAGTSARPLPLVTNPLDWLTRGPKWPQPRSRR